MRVEGVFRDAKETQSVVAGTVIFKEGETGDQMYGIVEGVVELASPAGIVAKLGPGDTFGEMAIIDRQTRMATATATSDTVLAVIDRQRFLWLVHETPTFALQVMSSMADRLRHL